MKGFTENGIEWISLEERKPKENDYILACYTINPTFPGHGEGVYTNVCFYPALNKWGNWVLGNFASVDGEVTHYMLHPRPPRKGSIRVEL